MWGISQRAMMGTRIIAAAGAMGGGVDRGRGRRRSNVEGGTPALDMETNGVARYLHIVASSNRAAFYGDATKTNRKQHDV